MRVIPQAYMWKCAANSYIHNPVRARLFHSTMEQKMTETRTERAFLKQADKKIMFLNFR